DDDMNGNSSCDVPSDCSGTVYVSDTPNQCLENYGCPNFPHLDGCTVAGNGVMYDNYMDYTYGNCEDMFSNGQKARMDATFSAYRSNLISATNMTATGTDGTAAVM